MKKIMIYESPEDDTEFAIANSGQDYHSVLWNIDQELREYFKHGHKFKSADEALECIRVSLRKEMEEHGCRFY